MLRKQLIILGVLSGILLATLGLVTLYGTSLDKDYSVKSAGIIDHDITTVWPYISDVSRLPSWNARISKVEESTDQAGHWTEHYANGDSLGFQLSIDAANYTVNRKIADSNAPFQGDWTIVLKALDGSKTEITIVENARIDNPFLRVMIHHLIGKETFQKNYIMSLRQGIER